MLTFGRQGPAPRARSWVNGPPAGPPCRLTFAMYRLPAESPVVWLAPDGKVVNHFLLHFYVYVGTHDPAPGTVDLPPGCGASG